MPLSERASVLFVTMIVVLGGHASAQTRLGEASEAPYKIINTVGFLCPGRFDYIYADSQARCLYVPRGEMVMTFDLDTLQQGKPVLNTYRTNGVTIDPKSKHGFTSSKPVVMWNTTTSEMIKTIDVKGDPRRIFFDPLTERVFVLSGTVPNGTVLDGKDGSIVGTLDLGGLPEQAASDGQGHLYIDLKDKDSVAVLDVNTLKVTGTFTLGGKGQQPCGLGLDAKNHILFVYCVNSSNVVILNAADGKILETLPTGRAVEVGGFNPQTMEAFSSQGDGTLTIIKEKNPASFMVEQTVATFSHARTCTLDAKTNNIILVAPEHLDKPTSPASPPVAFATPVQTATATYATASIASPGGYGTPGQAIPAVHRLGVMLHIFVVGR